MGDNQNLENNVTGTEETGRTFTQDEVNGIVQERLKKERDKYKKEQDAVFAEREKAVAAREVRMAAIEKLHGCGLPVELVNAINCSDEESIDNSIKILSEHMGNAGTKTVGGKYAYEPKNGNAGDPGDNIRRAMGLL